MKHKLPVHPILFCIFPVLFLYAQNATEMELGDLILPLLLICASTVALTVVIGLLLRSLMKGALLSTVIVFLFFSFGHAVKIIPEFTHQMAESVFGPSLLVLITFIVIIYLTSRIISRTRRDLGSATACLNWLGTLLVIFQVVHIGLTVVPRQSNPANTDETKIWTENAGRTATAPQNSYPDIYYIVLDGYGRSDILREIFAFDNSDFIDRLRQLGFYVADSSYANYPQTISSLGASLNMAYVDDLGSFLRTSGDRVPLMNKLQKNAVVKYLREAGYVVVSFESGYSATKMKEADTVLSPDWSSSEYQNILLSTTPLPLFAESRQSPFFQHRQRIRYIMDKLAVLSGMNFPKFVFAHVVSPHPPFVFDADGSPVRPKREWSLNDGSHLIKDSLDRIEYIDGYRRQITHMTQVILETVTEILEVSGDNPPVIILQSDHGPGSGLNWYYARQTNLRERLSILNAYYIPGLQPGVIYDEITPVNTFRIVLNKCFGANLDLLPDKHFYASWNQPYTFQPVSKLLGGSAYEHLLKQYSYLCPDTVAAEELLEPVQYDARINDENIHFMCEAGLCIAFNFKQRTSRFEVSIDYDDDYEFQFRAGQKVLAVDTVRHRWIKAKGIRIDTVLVPQDASKHGFDNIVIYPSGGNGWYAIGHLMPI
ncbi:MAG: hypothetical protein JSV52_06510 [Candidatus Zixiibacteriota bacterium]|nr:MAG: hypothetical protein JSV52_06510 [candidate division Zixibacteria bacterium]